MRRKASQTSSTSPAKVILNIKRGPASPAQKQAWKRFWQKLISEVKAEEPEGSGGQ